jgi:predicted amidophosphoribosyltransferase
MVIVAEQQSCDYCQAELRKRAAYCENCGQRTRRARRLVSVAVRIELLVLALIAAVIAGFVVAYTR